MIRIGGDLKAIQVQLAAHLVFVFFILREASTKDVAGSLFLCQNGQLIITLDLDTEVLWQR